MQQLAQSSAKEDQVVSNVQAILQSRGVVGSTVQILPANTLDTAPMGTEFSIQVTAPTASNLSGPALLPIGGSMTVTQFIYR
jgi:hypothetical protein